MKKRILNYIVYLKQLQLEYIVAELRSQIYFDDIDKKYYRRVMSYKRKKIEDLEIRNSLSCIFTNPNKFYYKEGLKKQLYSQIYDKWGLPNFIYKDEQHRREFENQDIQCYYYIGCKVQVLVDRDVIKEGKVYGVKIDEKLVGVNLLVNNVLTGEVMETTFDKVKRIDLNFDELNIK